MRRLAVLSFFALGVACTCHRNPGHDDGGEPDSGQPQCTLDTDCPFGLVCSLGACVEPATPDAATGCRTNADCAAPRVCVPSTGQCIDVTVPDAGELDAGAPAQCLDGQQRSCGVSKLGECRLGTQTCTDGEWSGCTGAVNPQPETCDGKDTDCDGIIDNGFDGVTLSCGSGACASTAQGCAGGVPGVCTPLAAPTCLQLSLNCGSLPDGCGNMMDCGSCSAPQTCGGGGTQNVCGCTAETDSAFCTRLMKNCDAVTANDNCAVSRRVTCGACIAPQTCGGGGTANVCGCTPETDAAFCGRLGKNCGMLGGTDNCGAARTTSCGGCIAPQTCGGGGTANVCGCTTETDAAFCARLGKNCGTVSGTDSCGVPRTAPCGTCTLPQVCGAAPPGVPNVCGGSGCTPETDSAFCMRLGKNCGPLSGTDNCMMARTVMSCGMCTAPLSCGGSGTANVCGCSPENDAQFCMRLGKNCDPLSGTDNCLMARTVTSCGVCSAPQSCGGGGTSNVCGCSAESDAQFCTRLGKNCGTLNGTDNCGSARTVSSCGPCNAPSTCTNNVCNCIATTCVLAGKNCGSISDGCGNMLNCGTCAGACGALAPNLSCGGGGTANVCGCNTGNTDVDLDGYTVCQGDCNDSNGAIRPCATEKCDGLDNNCTGRVDEGYDTDNDCFTGCGTNPACGGATISYDPGPNCRAPQTLSCALAYSGTTGACQPQAGTLSPGWADCNDTVAFVHPLKTYDCSGTNNSCTPDAGPGNNRDDNCNGRIDDTCACTNTDGDRDGFSQCQGDCCDTDVNVHPGAPELCDGKDNDCSPGTRENCSVGEQCGWPAPTCPAEPQGPDVCKDQLICVYDVQARVNKCTSWCNFSSQGAGLGDGCTSTQACNANLLNSDNIHGCIVPGMVGTQSSGTACSANTDCHSNACRADLSSVGGSACSDLCGSDGYCSGGTSCAVLDSTSMGKTVYAGNCAKPGGYWAGTKTQGQACTRCGGNPSCLPQCRSGNLGCVNGLCASVCCKPSDCSSGNFCSLTALTDGQTGTPVCVPKPGAQGSRTTGQACTTASQCASAFCEVQSFGGLCLDPCCNDTHCPTGFGCDMVAVTWSAGAELMRVCVPNPGTGLPDGGSLTLRMAP